MIEPTQSVAKDWTKRLSVVVFAMNTLADAVCAACGVALTVGLSIQTVSEIEINMFHKMLLAPLLAILFVAASAATVWRARHECNRLPQPPRA
jgi:membrane protein DedA with SNARE-associated domain